MCKGTYDTNIYKTWEDIFFFFVNSQHINRFILESSTNTKKIEQTTYTCFSIFENLSFYKHKQ